MSGLSQVKQSTGLVDYYFLDEANFPILYAVDPYREVEPIEENSKNPDQNIPELYVGREGQIVGLC